ncbi:MAG: response regulator transcription factor [Clostridia bacterium]|nr:response regulator transcription factor [Clostridia bacterium]
MLLLLAEDEAAMAEAVTAYLQYNQFQVDWVDNGIDALHQAQTGAYDALILDIMMPGLDGISVLKKLRAEDNPVPILLLTAKGEIRDKVEGFEAGADDYLPKPFALEELVVRVKALLRRGKVLHAAKLQVENLMLDKEACTLQVGQETCPLSRREYQLMEYLMRSPGLYFSADTLLDRVWGMDVEAEQGTVWVHISYLRKKLEKLGARVEIRSKRGIGYALEKKP